MRKMIKKISAIFVVLSVLCLAIVPVWAVEDSGRTQIINLFDFEDEAVNTLFTEEELLEKGISAVAGTAANFQVIEDDENKVLSYEIKTDAADLLFRFPRDFTVAEDEIIIVEFDAKYIRSEGGPVTNIKYGDIGLGVPIEINAGGNGSQVQVYTRSQTAHRKVINFYDSRNSNLETPWFRVKTTYDYGMYMEDASSDAVKLEMKNIATGATAGTILNKMNAIGTPADIALGKGVSFDLLSGVPGTILIDNVQVYTLRKMQILSSSIEDGAANVYTEGKTISIDFANAIDEFDDITVTKDGASVGFEADCTDDDTLLITLDEEFGYDASYEIDLTSVTDSFGQTNAKNIISFTTEESPVISLASYEEVNSLENFGAMISLENVSDAQEDVFVTVIAFDEDNVAKDVQNMIISIFPDETAQFRAGVKWNESWGNGYLKTFVWSTGNKPYFSPITIEK